MFFYKHNAYKAYIGSDLLKFWGRKIEKSTLELIKKSETCVKRKLRHREAHI